MMAPWIWLVYGGIVLAASVFVGRYLGRFREAYTEMTGMMVGMTMGMLSGFLIGYAAAAATGSSMFWGNLFGILIGTAVGVYYGRAGSLMGMMDGGMGGAMGGSMGAMLEVMLFAPVFVYWTAALMVGLYVLGMAGLVVLIERSSNDPQHAALHRTFPWLTRAIAEEVAEGLDREDAAVVARTARLADYYLLLGLPRNADPEAINDAYLDKLSSTAGADALALERAFSILSDPQKRAAYDRSRAALNGDDGRGDCCPPARKKVKSTQTTVLPETSPAPAPVRAAAPAVAASAARTQPAATVPVRSAAQASKAIPERRGQDRSHKQQAASHPQTQKGNARQQNQLQRSGSQAKGKHSRQAASQSPVSWVGVGALFVVVIFLAAWWLMGSGNTGAQGTQNSAWEPRHVSPPGLDAAQLEAQAVSAQVGADGIQTLDFTVNGDTWGYEPNVVKLKQGVPARLNIGTAGRDPGCGRYVVFKGLGAHGIAEPGKITPAEFTPSQAGVYEINCGMNMMNPGYLVVTQ